MANFHMRSWLQISLRGMFVAITLLCVALGWFVWQARQQREAVNWVQSHGGQVAYEYQLSETNFIVHGVWRDADPFAPTWLVELIGIDYFDSVVEVDLRQKNITEFSPLVKLPYLKMLAVSGCPLNDLSPLEHLNCLEMLYLNNTNVHDISPLRNL
jgi:Leucine-rich repeat (LRR) protein